MNHAGVEEQVAGLHRGYWIGAALVAVSIAGVYELGHCPCSGMEAKAAAPTRIRHRGVIPESFRQLVRSTFDAEVTGGRDGMLRVQSGACNQASAERVIAATRK